MSAAEALESALSESGLDEMADPSDILDALKAAGYAVVELPKPVAEHVGDGDGTEWETGIPDGLVTSYTTPPEVFIDSDSLRIDQARALAAALLAAAAATEATS